MSIDARIPLSFTSGREAEQLGNGILTGQSIAANRQQLAVGEAEAAAAKRQKEMQGLTAITNSLAYLDTMPAERKAGALENIKRFARTAFDDPNGYIDQITLENLPQIRAAITPYMDQLKEGTQVANTGFVNAKTADIGIDNARADWKTSADIADANQRTALYGSGIANANANRDAGTALAYEKARVTGFGQLPDGQIMGADGSAQMIPGYTPPATGGNLGAITANPDGSVTVQPFTGKLTEAQSKDIVYARRAARASKTLDEIGTALTDLGDRGAAGMGLLGNYLKSDKYQAAEVAAREAITAFLRKETGAAISDAEWGYYAPMILPQPGDSEAVIKQKAENRRQMVQDIETGLGAAGVLTQQPGIGGGPQPGQVEDGFRFKGGDPADPTNWEPAQ